MLSVHPSLLELSALCPGMPRHECILSRLRVLDPDMPLSKHSQIGQYSFQSVYQRCTLVFSIHPRLILFLPNKPLYQPSVRQLY